MPVVPRSLFGSNEVKKAYRKLAKKYHPDKVALLPKSE
jgi:curved DNA-binding protein CbpA